MKKLIFLIFAALLISSAVSAQNAGVTVQNEQIVWEKDYKKALALARESGRPLMLDFTAPWCKPCKAMDAEFWVLPEVINAAKPFIAVKVDFDNDKNLVGKYNVAAIPYVVFTDPLGNIITARRGFSSKKAAELNQIFEEMPKDFSPMKKLYDAIELKKDDGAALLQIADSYRAAKMLFLSNEFYQRALKTNEIENDAEKKERIMLTLGANAHALKLFERAAEYLEDYLKAYPAHKNREIAITLLVYGYVSRDKLKSANKYLEMLKAEFPSSKYVETGNKAIEDAKNKK